MEIYRIPKDEFLAWIKKISNTPHIEVLEEDMSFGSDFSGSGKYRNKKTDTIFYMYTY